MTSPLIQMELKSDPRVLSGVRELVAALCRRLTFEKAPADQIALAVDEALANVICHGYARCPDCPIWISIHELQADQPAVKIVIEDEASPVECDQIKGRDLHEVRPGGLGVHIIREIMDDVVYEKRPNVGMRLTMTRTGNRESNATSSRQQKDAP